MKWTDPKTYLKKLELTEFPQPDIIQLKYPILMCHGFGGITMLISPSPMHYPCMRLREFGIHAFAPNIVPYASIETRAEQWVNAIHLLKEKYGYNKINIVAHSMAGLDMRHAITFLDIKESIASLTTIATPHYGTTLAELVLTAPEPIKEKLAELVDWFGESIFPFQKSDAVAALKQLTREYVTEQFNPKTPDAEDIPYFSYSAAVGKGTDQPLNPIFRLQNQLIYQQEGVNDSFVSSESSKWGKHIKTSGLSHLEQIEIQVSKERKPEVVEFWRDIVLNLKENGL